MKKAILVVIMVFMAAVADVGAEISVPGDYSTIQGAIDAAVDGNTIVVSPGTYFENIDFGGKNIILTSTDPDNSVVVAGTVIDGSGNGTVVLFSGSENSSTLLTGFTITGGDNTGYDGGGIHGELTSASVDKCIITGNFATHDGGGISRVNGGISNCVIMENSARFKGGGLNRCIGRISNCVICGNTATSVGAMYKCSGEIINCTIVGNTSRSVGERVLVDCYGTITNCIIWDNGLNILFDSATPTYSCIENWTGGGTGNITTDPGFVLAEDYHPAAGSVCIDAGDNTAVPAGIVADFDGAVRFYDDPATTDTGNGSPPIVDMGAYEYGQLPRIGISPKSFNFFGVSDFFVLNYGVDPNEQNPNAQILSIRDCGVDALNWTITEDCDWLEVDPNTGSSTGDINEVTFSVDVTGLDSADYDCELTISDPNAANNPQTILVNLSVYCGGCYTGPDCAAWIARGKPDSWCYPRQCHGDADGTEEYIGRGIFWVADADITVLLSGYKLAYPGVPSGDPPADPDTTHPWIAADFDHAAEYIGRSWYAVSDNDITVLLRRYRSFSVPPDCQTATPVVP